MTRGKFSTRKPRVQEKPIHLQENNTYKLIGNTRLLIRKLALSHTTFLRQIAQNKFGTTPELNPNL